MDFFSIRKKAKERAGKKAAPEGPAAPASAPPAPAAPPALEDALRAELQRLEAPPAPAPEAQPPPGPAPALPPPAAAPAAAAAAPAAPFDPLDEFFWSEGEIAPALPDLGLAGSEGPADAAAVALREYVTFLLGGEEYGLAIEQVREILRPPPITEVPRAPGHVLGVITLRGEVVPVLDARRCLSLPPAAPGPRSRIVVCDGAEGRVGLLVDSVSQVVRLPAGAIEPRPPGVGGAAAEAIAGIGREGDRLVVLLHLDVLLGAAAAPAEVRA